ncbi:N-acetylglutamate synthase, GNAT family [Sinosporangium album]|uniref:N-acetylglutamate synthase, GNAT family n=1 Tax=Sinosporangium album TaxID=504805 RepID=A0A1G7T2N2_9ACTN|nr:GNAT family N-acetyltransferase [Sinosporangium album]SDG29352.1 N-acetylglutamate synthase, GNAT family [Sinosporangium album]
MIRPAEENDLPLLQDIERAAGACFADIGMAFVAEDEPLPLDVLREYQRDSRAWVYTDPAGHPVAYLLADIVDGNAHIEQVSVHPAHAGRRLGHALLEHAAHWARSRGHRALTLTTFTHVPWNGPYYQRRGFRYLDDAQLTPGLYAIRASEAAHGLDQWPRACMRRDLTP